MKTMYYEIGSNLYKIENIQSVDTDVDESKEIKNGHSISLAHAICSKVFGENEEEKFIPLSENMKHILINDENVFFAIRKKGNKMKIVRFNLTVFEKDNTFLK